MKEYEMPVMQVVSFEADDVITTSGGISGGSAGGNVGGSGTED